MGPWGALIAGRKFNGWSLTALLGLILFLLFPVNTWLFDLLLALCLFAALFFFSVCFLGRDRQSLYALPQGLMTLMLFRIVVEVAGSRLYLTTLGRGNDSFGQVLTAIGAGLLNADWVIAATVLLVVFVVNFVVVTKGVARIAEVLARFSLDAMPGKQLAIDADFRTGAINQEQAKERRSALAQESRFYGAMDGSMRLIQGDLALSVFLTVIIFFAGLLISFRADADLTEVAAKIALDSCSFGLFFSLTALLIALGTANAISKYTDQEKHAAKDLAAIFVKQKELIFFLGILSVLLGCSPWLPFWPFFILGVLVLASMAGQALFSNRRGHKYPFAFESYLNTPQKLLDVMPIAAGTLLSLEQSAEIKPVVLAISHELIVALSFDLDDGHSDFWQSYEKTRQELFSRRGLLLPMPHLIVSSALAKNEASIVLNEQEIKKITLDAASTFIEAAADFVANLQIAAQQEIQHPLTRQKCCWATLSKIQKQACQELNITTFNGQEYLALELAAVLLHSINQFYGLDYLTKAIDGLRVEHNGLIVEVIDKKVISMFELSELVRRLVNEAINVRDLKQLLELVARFYSLGQDSEDRSSWLAALHVFVRKNMLAGILATCAENNRIKAFVLSAQAQRIIARNVQAIDAWKEQLVLEPLLERDLRKNLTQLFEPVINRGLLPLTMVVEESLRYSWQEYLAGIYSHYAIRVFSFAEIPSNYGLDVIAAVAVEEKDMKG